MNNYESNRTKEKIKNRNLNWFIILKNFYILILIFSLIIESKTQSFNEIFIIINKTLKREIIRHSYFQFISGVIVNNIQYTSNIEEEVDIAINNSEYILNNITIKFRTALPSCWKMFENLTNIKFVDLSKFDSSLINRTDYMFCGCKSLLSINFDNFDTSSVVNMGDMFSFCESLLSLNLSSFNTSKVFNMSNMFFNCCSIEILDLNHFDTSLVTDMRFIFSNCKKLKALYVDKFNTTKVQRFSDLFRSCNSLTSLNISKWNTSNVDFMAYMFYGCQVLLSIDLSNFDTSHVTDFRYMFGDCKVLTSLNLSSFKTSSLTRMNSMFNFCKKLESLDLSSFDTSSVTDMQSAFRYCGSLKYLNINNFNTSSTINMTQMFYNCSSLLSLNLTNFDTTYLINHIDIFTNCNTKLMYCIDDNKQYHKNFTSQLQPFIKACNFICFNYSNQRLIKENNICVDNCSNYENYLYEYNYTCNEKCPNYTFPSNNNICQKYYIYNNNEYFIDLPEGYYIIDDNEKTIGRCDIKCTNCTKESMQENLCIECNISKSYYPKFNSRDNNGFINCYNNISIEDGYYLDDNEYKQCYPTCKKCSKFGNVTNQECISCYSNYTLNESNCYEKCNYYYYFNSLKEYFCTLNNNCPDNYSKLIINKNQCIYKCENDDKYVYEYNNECYEQCPLNKKLIIDKKLCIDNCSNDDNYHYEYNNSCYENCPNNSKIIENTNICIDNCLNNEYKIYEYNNICYAKCSNNSKLIVNTNLCIDNCLNTESTILEYNNTCYQQCPIDTKLIENKNLCIDNCSNDNQYKYEYNNTCYQQCPNNSKIIENTNICTDNCLNTENNKFEYNNICYNKCPTSTYYYNKTKICYDKIPSGFYCNDREHKTLDICHENCKECSGPPKMNNSNCLSCPKTGNIYLDLGNCINNCSNGFFIDSEQNKICKCINNRKCNYCSEESNELDLCINCNNEEGYYQINNDVFRKDGFVNCFKSPEGYYLNEFYKFYEKCYNTCRFCTSIGTEENHKCINCSHKYILINDFQDIYNCYEDCSFYYYYDKENYNKYKCTLEKNCPEKYNKLVIEKRRCIDDCKNDNIYNMNMKINVINHVLNIHFFHLIYLIYVKI